MRPELRGELLVWQVVKSGLATYTEIETSWSFSDLMKSAAFLQFQDDQQFLASSKPGGRSK